ncbi:MAG: hypothetical protein WAM94_19765 [Chromatiaceae bacterium]
MGWLWIAAAFVLFTAVIGSAHAMDRYCAGRYGYRPLALPNLAFMLIPHGVLLAACSGLSPGDDLFHGLAAPPGASWVLAGLAAGALIFMLATLTRRTTAWIAMAATALMTAAASVLLFSVFFRELAQTPPDREP